MPIAVLGCIFGVRFRMLISSSGFTVPRASRCPEQYYKVRLVPPTNSTYRANMRKIYVDI